MHAGLALTTNDLTTVSVLGVALTVVSVALVISCTGNILLYRIWKQDRQKIANNVCLPLNSICVHACCKGCCAMVTVNYFVSLQNQQESGLNFTITNEGFEDLTPYHRVITS